MILVVLLLIPLLAAVLIVVTRRLKAIEAIHTSAALACGVVGIAVTASVWRENGGSAAAGFGRIGLQLRVDSLSALMIVLITVLGAIIAIYSVGYIRASRHYFDDRKVRTFFALFHGFLFTMLVAVTTDNLGVMWVAIEGTTLATVFLVNLRDTRASIEAAYKYLMISSIGIALAFVGTALIYYAGANRSGDLAVNWTSLKATASSLDPHVVRLAFAFVLIGYGTKAGLAPMHTWLPDAHSEAPAPISSLMSGVLLNVGLYALLRFKAVADISLGYEFSSHCLIAFGLLSLAVAAAFLLAQRSFKRMLAYSSVEHMGIICLGIGFGGYWGVLGALLHVVNHAFSKSLLFMLSGDILLRYQTTDIFRVRGLLRSSPIVGGMFLTGTLALMGLPPFGLFISEFMIFRAGFDHGPRWAALIGVALLVVVFAGMLMNLNRMLYGDPPEKTAQRDQARWRLAPLTINLAVLVALGLTLPHPILRALEQAVRIIGAKI